MVTSLRELALPSALLGVTLLKEFYKDSIYTQKNIIIIMPDNSKSQMITFSSKASLYCAKNYSTYSMFHAL